MLGGVALLLFGPEQFPKVARRAGSFVRDMQMTSQSFIREIERAADLHDAPPAHHDDDLITAGSGDGPRVAGEGTSTHVDHDLGSMPGVVHESYDWSAAPLVEDVEFDAEPLAGTGTSIDPSAKLVLTAEGEVRHAADVGGSGDLSGAEIAAVP